MSKVGQVSKVRHGIVLAPSPENERKVTGLTLGERGRRVAVRAGIDAANVVVVRKPDDVPASLDGGLVVIDARDHVVAAQLVEPLRLADDGDRYAPGAWKVDDPAPALAKLRDGGVPDDVGERVEVNDRARHPARTPEDLEGANAWQWALVNKPLDAFLTRRFWRPCARPLTKIALHLPFTPNMISVACIALSIVGGVVAASGEYKWHAIGFAIYFFAALLDNVDGEIARLRLEGSNLGGWIDTIGDDLARFAVIIGIFFHVQARHPDLPIGWLTAVTLLNAAIANVLLYWWCIFVGKTYNNQEYAKVIGAAPHEQTAQKSWKRAFADFAASAARRDFLDVGVIALALLNLSEVSVVALTIGQAVGLAIIIPIHLAIVRRRRVERASKRPPEPEISAP